LRIGGEPARVRRDRAGSSSDSCPVFRPFSGSADSVVPEMTSPTVADSVCSTWAGC
jgi:hypothetical protein